MINETKLEYLILSDIIRNCHEYGNIYDDISEENYNIQKLENRFNQLQKQFLEPYKITE